MLRVRFSDLLSSLARPIFARASEATLLFARALNPRVAALSLLFGFSLHVLPVHADGGFREVVAAASGSVTAEEQARRAQPVAKGSSFAITVGQLEDYIAKQPPALRTRYGTLEQRQELLNNLLRLELLANEAQRRGLDKNVAVRRTVRDNAVQALMRTEVDDKITAEAITATDIAAFYEQNPQEFHHPAQRRASQIVLASQAEADALMADAKKADLRGFGDLARKQSIDAETKLRGGDLSFFTAEPSPQDAGRKTDPAVRKAVFALKEVGDTVDKPVPVNGQFVIVRLTGERPERHVTLAEADGSVRGKLWRENRQKAVAALIDGLRARDKPKVFSERVDLVKFDDMDKRPPGFMPDLTPSDAGRKNTTTN